jgi:hypothetical protein
MLLKSTDDKSRRIALLEDLQRSDRIDARQRRWLREELSRVRIGIEGEKESAYFLDQHFKGGKNHVWLHDLRIVVDGDVAQIDHLVINRAFGMYLIETKNYGGNVSINEQGEFTIDYGEESFGIPSPIEQSRRHARILLRLMERLGIGNRTGSPLQCHHVVMFHPRAIIRRPPQSAVDTSNIIKADQFPSWHEKFTSDDGISALETLRGLVNVRSLETIKEWGDKLIRQHRPANPLELPEFMTVNPPGPPVLETTATSAPRASMERAGPVTPTVDRQKKLICLQCNAKISFNEGRFCWNQEARFKGGQYCREHQKLFPA